MPEDQANSTSDDKENDKADAPAVTVLEEDHLNKDERGLAHWKSRYDVEARKEIRLDAIYVSAVLFLTLSALVLTWAGIFFNFIACYCDGCSETVFNRYAYFFLGGLLGGTLFGIKYLYKVVARGYWNIDRRLWRIFSPFLSGGLALAIGALIDSGIFGLTIKTPTPAAFFSMGFIAGYFADSALAKMQEIADTVFGSPEHAKRATKTTSSGK